MPRADAVLILSIVGFAAAGFAIPELRAAKHAGVSLFGWWMAALMLLAPIGALVRMAKK